MIKVAAAGDIHAGGPGDERFAGVFADAGREADLVLLAGDLTRHGDPAEVGRLAEAVQGIAVPVFAVLGNHDWHGNRCDELVEVLGEAGIRMLDKSSAVAEVGETSVGMKKLIADETDGFPKRSVKSGWTR